MTGLIYESAGELVSIEFDALTDEAHSHTAEITSHPLEDGSIITDHVRSSPFTLTCKAVVTNTPIKVPSSFADGVTGQFVPRDITIESPARFAGPLLVAGIAPGVAAVKPTLIPATKQTARINVFEFSAGFDRVTNVYDELVRLMRLGTLITVETTLKTYERMVLAAVQVGRDAPRGNILEASLTFSQVTLVRTQTIQVSAPIARRPRARGTQAARELTPEERRAARQSGLAAATDQIGEFFRF